MVKFLNFFNKSSSVPLGDGTALVIDEVGAIKIKVFKILSREEDLVIISFEDGEKFKIKAKNIRAKRTIIYKTSSGKVICQDPDNWGKVDLKEYGIKEFRFNLQNFSLQEGKAAIHRWTLPKTNMDKLLPLLKLLFICISICVLGWSALKGGTYVLDKVISSRLIDCSSFIPNIAPIGTNIFTNATNIPLGA